VSAIWALQVCRRTLTISARRGTYLPKGIYGAWLLFFVSARTNKRHHHQVDLLILPRFDDCPHFFSLSLPLHRKMSVAIPKQYARAKSAIPTENVWSRDILTNVSDSETCSGLCRHETVTFSRMSATRSSDSEHRVARLDAISFAGAYFSQVREFVRIRSRR